MIHTLAKKKRPTTSGKSTNGTVKSANGAISVHRFTVDDYHRMIDAGILTPNDKVELLEGWIVDKMPQNPPHMTSVTRIWRWLTKVLSEEDWTVRGPGPITLDVSEPEPDIAVARGPDRRYEKHHPRPEDVALIIETGDSSLLDDRRRKGPLYAAAKIPAFWLVNLQSKRIEVHTNPQSERGLSFYGNILELPASATIQLVLDGKVYGEIKVKQLLG